MKVFIASDFRCTVYKGQYYLSSKIYNIYRRYADMFGDIILCSRFVEVNKEPFDHTKVEFISDIVEIGSLNKVLLGKYDKQILKKMVDCDVVVGRMPSSVALKANKCAKKLNKTFFAEVMGCAWDAYWNHSLKGKIIAPYMYFATRKAVRNADYALYVTDRFLQSRYPCNNESVGVSNVKISNLDTNVLEKRIKKIEKDSRVELILMTTAAVDVKYKGQEYVIKAIPKLNQSNVRVKYKLVGGGDSSRLEKIAENCGVLSQVEFLGEQSHDNVFKLLEEIDIYIQPSLQEGLPRAVIEAMSKACPCLGANTAGIPELLDDNCVFERKSSKAIYETIMKNYNTDKMISSAKSNFLRAEDFLEEKLNYRRNEYYKKVLNEIKCDVV